MQLENRCLVAADRAAAWQLLLDLPRAAACIPGLGELTADGENRFGGTMQAQAGPLRVTLAGSVQILAQDADKGVAQLLLEAADRRLGGSVRANVTLRLTETAAGQTELTILSDTAFGGRLATLGQPLIRRKAAATIEEFAHNLGQLLGESGFKHG